MYLLPSTVDDGVRVCHCIKKPSPPLCSLIPFKMQTKVPPNRYHLNIIGLEAIIVCCLLRISAVLIDLLLPLNIMIYKIISYQRRENGNQIYIILCWVMMWCFWGNKKELLTVQKCILIYNFKQHPSISSSICIFSHRINNNNNKENSSTSRTSMKN